MFAMTKSLNLDANCPPRSPRQASVAEAEEIQKVREMQARILRNMGARSVASISSQDMGAILSGMGGNWVEALPTYQLALNAMDQNVAC
jgi:hypothetical protein